MQRVMGPVENAQIADLVVDVIVIPHQIRFKAYFDSFILLHCKFEGLFGRIRKKSWLKNGSERIANCCAPRNV